MIRGAASPEELETLLEDAFLLHDQQALPGLFAGHAVLSSADGRPDAHGRSDIARRIGAIWDQAAAISRTRRASCRPARRR